MGKELETTITINRVKKPGRVLLETGAIIIRGAHARRAAFGEMQDLAVARGALRFGHRGDAVSIALGDAAAAWLEAIRNPRTRMQKLGAAPGLSVCVLGPAETDALSEIALATGEKPGRRLKKQNDLVLLFAPEPADLGALTTIEPSLAAKGAVWVLWPKGRKDFAHQDVVAAGKRAGLSQTKSMGFSPVYTGLRLVRAAKKVKA